MSAAHPDYSKHGFQGNPDIYGIGIRVGYYTQAASLWVANLFAPQEAPFLQRLAQLFTISMLVGICQLSTQRLTTHSVEPFLLMQIAYNISFMGIYGYPTQELLKWERRYSQEFTAGILTVALHCYDLWYWWIGRLVLIPTNGPEGSPIYFPYIGREDLYGWVHHLAKVGVSVMLGVYLIVIVMLAAYGYQQWRMDRDMPPSKFASLTIRWLEEARFADPVDAVLEKPTSVWISQDDKSSNVVETRRSIFAKLRRISTLSSDDTESKDDDISQLSPESVFTTEKPIIQTQEILMADIDDVVTDQEAQQDLSSPELVHHTNTSIFRTAFLGRSWSTKSKTSKCRAHRRNRRSISHQDRQSYTSHIIFPSNNSYKPSFTQLLEADAFLAAVYPQEPRRFRDRTWLRDWLLAPLTLLSVLLTHRLRLRLLLATLSYGSNLGFTCHVSYPSIVRRTLTHPSYPTLSWRDIAILSRIKLILNPPAPPSMTRRLWQAWTLFGACAVLVIATELTLQWNYVTGINNINSVGQLVPFSVGVGALIRVCWSAVVDRKEREGRWNGECTVEEKVGPWKEAGECWVRVKGVFEKRCRGMDRLGEEMDDSPLKVKVGF